MTLHRDFPAHSTSRRLARLGAGACLALGALMCKQSEPTGSSAGAAQPSPSPATESAALKAAEPAAAGKPSGIVRVVSANGDVLQRPTTGAFRGQTLWVAIGQLSALFGSGQQPKLPFGAISVNVESGALGEQKIDLPGDDYYPEGIASAPDGTLYIGSIMQGVIVKAAPDATTAVPFVPKGVAQRGVLGLTVDAPRQLLWFCDSNPKLEDSKKAGALVAVQLADAKEVVRHDLPAFEGKAPFCNDVVVSPDGAIYSTESATGRVFRIPADAALRPGSAEAWVTGGDVGAPAKGSGANGLVWVEGQLIVANVGRGTLVALDPSSTAPDRNARVIPLTDAQTKAPVTLCSPDGLESLPTSPQTLLVVENGGCDAKTPRISEVTLDLGK